jgi:hypothetical protein
MAFHLSLSFLDGSLLFELLLELKLHLLDDELVELNLAILTYNKSEIKLNTSFPLYKTKVKQKFMAPNSELIPDKCKPKIAKSTLAPL